MSEYVLFHRIEDPRSAAIRREVVARGLKPLFDFQNVDSDEGRERFAASGGTTVPAIWDGSSLWTDGAEIAALLDTLPKRPRMNGATLAGVVVNVALRAHIAYFLAEVLLNPNDPRFAGKAIPVRNLIIVGGLSLLFPALHFIRRRWTRYPVWTDSLWLSLFWLDMAGNSFDLYDRYLHFDLIPHFHGSGASAVAIERAFGISPPSAFVIANALHSALEAQEFLTDVFFGTHNVRGWWDSAGDIAAGILGTGLYLGAERYFRGR